MRRVVIILVILLGFWSGVAEGQMYSVFNMPDDYVTQIINESFLKEAYYTYKNCLTRNKVRKVHLTNDRGRSEIFEYNKNGLVTKWEIIGNSSSSHYTLLYNKDGNLFAAIYPWQSLTLPDTICTYSIYDGRRINYRHFHSRHGINFYKFIYDSLLTDKLTDVLFFYDKPAFEQSFKMEYDSEGSLSGFLFPDGSKYISILRDSNSAAVVRANKFYYKYTFSDNKIREFLTEKSRVNYFYNKDGLVDYSIDYYTDVRSVKTMYKYEYYDK